jgi:hypothetical protein
MMGGLSVRETARELGISKNTAFAWRHKVIARLAVLDSRTRLGGIVEADQFFLLKCHKGSPAEARKFRDSAWNLCRGNRTMAPAEARACVVVAADRRGNVMATVMPGESSKGLDQALRDHLEPEARVCVARDMCHWPRPSLDSIGLTWVSKGRNRAFHRDEYSNHPLHHVRNVRSLILGFSRWLLRFRGVATKYLVRYSAWYWQVLSGAAMSRPAAAKRMFMVLLQQFRL